MSAQERGKGRAVAAASVDTTALDGVRVVDATVGDAGQVARLLADLGADVVKIETACEYGDRTRAPLVGGVSVPFALQNANKRSVVFDPSSDGDRKQFADLVGTADILIDSGMPGQSAMYGRSCLEHADQFGHLVAMTITDFGSTGPRADWRGTDPVLVAMSSVLSRSGTPEGPPVLPPAGLASATAAAQAAWAVLVAYYHRLRTGCGDYIDFSRYEAVLQALDPPFGAQGQAAAARGRNTARRGRPKNQDSYPIFACRDGWVRICILAPRQWRAMRAWLGEPGEFQDPKYDTISARAVDFGRLRVLIAELFAHSDADDLVAQGAERGVPVAAILTPTAVANVEHFRKVSAWTEADLAGSPLTVPDGCIVVDGQRAGVRRLPGEAGSDEPKWVGASGRAWPTEVVARPFEGLTILDLGVIVAGGELGRLFADMGADVVKIESPAYPDGLRQARPGQVMSESFAWTHRNQQGLGLDLRAPAGAAVFGSLVERADAVFANFKPGTLTSLGFSFDRLRELNPRIVLTESSAFGDAGPWSSRLGYGPLVRASTGITQLWISDGTACEETLYPFSDAVTVYPDHIVARLAAVATLAALIRRGRTGRGAHIHISQAETAMSQLDVLYATEWARDRGATVVDDMTIHGVYPCAGDDEWCAISIGADDWDALVRVLGVGDRASDPRFSTQESRWRHRDEIAVVIGDLTTHVTADSVADRLQRAGVAAAKMLRAGDILEEPQVLARSLYTDMRHPSFDVALPTETGPAPYRRIPPAELRPAPVLGEHTVDVCHRLAGLDDTTIEELIADGVLFAPRTLTVNDEVSAR